MADAERKISMEKARAGSSEHVVRYVLAVSLGLAVLAMLFVWIVW